MKSLKESSTKGLVDIGINLTNKAFRKNWRDVVRRAVDAGVDQILLTGTSISNAKQSINMAQTWFEETGKKNLFCTVGVHPHHAKDFDENTLSEMRKLLKHPLVKAVGECGLDYNRNFSSKKDQIRAFTEQVRLACELQLPMFLHEREAHNDLMKVLMEQEKSSPLPPIVVHCFTGTESEAKAYIQNGYYIGFTGTICKKERGAPLRKILPALPLERIMLETDAPFMGFRKGQRNSEPMDVIGVAETFANTIDSSFEEVCRITTENALSFFRLNDH